MNFMIKSDLPILIDCEVLVIGGGPAGAIAAVAAAREGMQTVLVEQHGFLGGNLTAAGIDTMYGIYSVGQNPAKMVGGYFDEVVERLKAWKACYERVNTYGAGTGLTFGVEEMKLVLENMARESGVQLLYHALVPDVYHDQDGQLAGVIVASKSGLQKICAKIMIDASGDADVVARAGGPVERPGEVGPVQSCTAVFFMANVDLEAYRRWGGKKSLWEAMRQADQDGSYKLPRLEGSLHATPEPTQIEANMTRIPNVDATDARSVTEAEIVGRGQVREYARFLVENVPGFENAYLTRTGSSLGIREGRRVIGDYVLTRDDVIEGHKFPDAIVRCGQPIEDHHGGSDTKWVYVKEYGYYEIPFGCLVPRGMENVLTAGRCLSATHDAHASARSSATAMGMGQAAGVAAAMALSSGVEIRQISAAKLQKRLRYLGAPL